MTEMSPSIEFEKKSYEVKEIAPLGVGNPDSTISYKKQIASGELSPEADMTAVEIIMNGEAMCELTDSDDGCIDGREAGRVSYPTSDGEFKRKIAVEDSGEHIRLKVAGGGYITTLAMLTGRGQNSESMTTDLGEIIDSLAQKGIYCGAHIGEHGHGPATDCGANDKFPPILEAGIFHQSVIKENTITLINEAGLEVDQVLLDSVFNNWAQAINVGYGKDSSGADRLELIENGLQNLQQKADGVDKPVAVTKDLKGDHKEDYIVINYREGVTFSQAAMNKLFAEQHPGIDAQAFVVDVPRIVELAAAQAGSDERALHEALYAGVAFQLATAATLTDGSLRTFIVK